MMEKEVTVMDLENLCRICLKPPEDPICLSSIVYSTFSQEMTTYDVQLADITQLEINIDGLPKQLCKGCSIQLHDFHTFRSKTIKNEEYLRDLISQQSQDVNQVTKMEEFEEEEIQMVVYQMDEVGYVPEALSDDDGDDDTHKTQAVTPKINVKRTIKNTQAEYNCPVCDKAFIDPKAQKIHMRFHTGENLKKCPKCDKSFLKHAHLERHMLYHGEMKKCTYCMEEFDMIKPYQLHLQKCHPHEVAKERSHKRKETRLTSIGLPSKKYLADKSVMCKICDQTFHHIQKLRNHLLDHRENVTELQNVNLFCRPYLFGNVDNLMEHDNASLASELGKKLHAEDYTFCYQILSREGHELDVIDSDTDTENMTVDLPYTCSKCGATFIRSRELLEHVDIHHNLVIFPDKCEKCSKQFPCKTLLDRHLRQQCENHVKTFFCNYCSSRFMWQDSLDVHIELYHDTHKSRKYSCNICNKYFQRAEHLERHKKIHNPSEKKFECPECHKKFNRKDNLRVHMRTHDPNREIESKYLCTFCGKSFSNSSNLIVHTRRHTKETPYKCEFCGKGFPRGSDLVCHRRTHTGDKPFICQTCGKAFSRSNKLLRHERIHKNIRLYKCPYCEKSFVQSNDLTLHIRRHTGELPFSCGVCGKKFIQGTSLKAHQKQFNHFDPNSTQDPDPYRHVSVNNPNRFDKKSRFKIDGTEGDEPVIRPVTRGRKSTKNPKKSKVKEIKVEIKQETQEHQEPPSANYNVQFLSNGSIVMAEVPPIQFTSQS